MQKNAKEGGTIIVDDSLIIEIPPPNFWWDTDDLVGEVEKEQDREAVGKH